MNPDGFIDYKLVYDHCHPSVEGNWVIAGALAEFLLQSDLAGLEPSPGTDISQWTADGRDAAVAEKAPDPRLWEWSGRDFTGDQPEYIPEVQVVWREIIGGFETSAQAPDADAMDWLWAGNGRYYDYRAGDALKAWDRALELDPSLCLAWANRAYGLRQIGARDEALRSAEKAVACDRDNEEYRAERDLLLRLSR